MEPVHFRTMGIVRPRKLATATVRRRGANFGGKGTGPGAQEKQRSAAVTGNADRVEANGDRVEASDRKAGTKGLARSGRDVSARAGLASGRTGERNGVVTGSVGDLIAPARLIRKKWAACCGSCRRKSACCGGKCSNCGSSGSPVLPMIVSDSTARPATVNADRERAIVPGMASGPHGMAIARGLVADRTENGPRFPEMASVDRAGRIVPVMANGPRGMAIARSRRRSQKNLQSEQQKNFGGTAR